MQNNTSYWTNSSLYMMLDLLLSLGFTPNTLGVWTVNQKRVNNYRPFTTTILCNFRSGCSGGWRKWGSFGLASTDNTPSIFVHYRFCTTQLPQVDLLCCAQDIVCEPSIPQTHSHYTIWENCNWGCLSLSGALSRPFLLCSKPAHLLVIIEPGKTSSTLLQIPCGQITDWDTVAH
jgi:hypothetical protein